VLIVTFLVVVVVVVNAMPVYEGEMVVPFKVYGEDTFEAVQKLNEKMGNGELDPVEMTVERSSDGD
jgi:hypothetical protein